MMGKKKVIGVTNNQAFKVEEVQAIIVPKFEELSLSKVYKKILQKYRNVEDYMPQYEEEGYMPPRQFFWDVLNTLEPQFIKKLLNNAHSKWVDGEEGDLKDKILIRSDVLEAIQNASFISRKNHSWWS